MYGKKAGRYAHGVNDYVSAAYPGEVSNAYSSKSDMGYLEPRNENPVVPHNLRKIQL